MCTQVHRFCKTQKEKPQVSLETKSSEARLPNSFNVDLALQTSFGRGLVLSDVNQVQEGGAGCGSHFGENVLAENPPIKRTEAKGRALTISRAHTPSTTFVLEKCERGFQLLDAPVALTKSRVLGMQRSHGDGERCSRGRAGGWGGGRLRGPGVLGCPGREEPSRH